MKTTTIFRILPMLLLTVAAGLILLMLVYALQHPQVMTVLATVSWNGRFAH
jgi:hypothetical protein